MQNLRKLGLSIFFAAILLLLVVGGLSASLAESRINAKPQPTITEMSLPTFDAGVSSMTPNLLASVTAVLSPTSTATLPPPTSCPPPNGWVPYIVQPGDTLSSLALRYGIAKSTLQQANCLLSENLIPNTRIYTPFIPTATYIPCGAPAGWVFYTVQAGDNLYRISQKYRISVAELQTANCMGYSTTISVGQKLHVPNVATSTPVKTHTPTSTPSPTITETNIVPSETATFTATATFTDTPLPPTDTPTPTDTATDVPPTSTP